MKYTNYQVIGTLGSVLLSLMGNEAATASAWTLEPSEAQIILTGAYSSTHTLIDEDGQRIDLKTFTKSDSRLYLEFGVFEKIMLVGQAGYQFIDLSGAGSEVDYAGFDETKLGLQYQLKRREGLAASILVSYILDGGLDNPRLNLGGRNDEVEVRALYGRSKPLKSDQSARWAWFYDLQLGARYDLKHDGLSRWQIDLTAGVKPTERWMGLVQIYGQEIKGQRNRGFTVPKTQQAKLELSLAYHLRPNHYVQIGALHTFAGRNVVKETGLFTGLWRKF